ncbi:hypothetical protein COBT_001081 [Conglomerata obtusa]
MIANISFSNSLSQYYQTGLNNTGMPDIIYDHVENQNIKNDGFELMAKFAIDGIIVTGQKYNKDYLSKNDLEKKESYQRQNSLYRRQILTYNFTNKKPPKIKTNYTTNRKQNIFERNTTQRTNNMQPATLNSMQNIYDALVEREKKSQFEEQDIDDKKLQSSRKQSDFRLQANKAAKNQTSNVIMTKRFIEDSIHIEEEKYTFNPMDEVRIPVIIQYMPIKPDTETFERLNNKLKESLEDTNLIENCDFFDLKFLVAPELSIRLIERQCNNRQKGIICYGFLKNKKILNGVECGLDYVEIAVKTSDYYFIKNIIIFNISRTAYS